MKARQPTPSFVWYLLWLGLILGSASYHWIYPPIVFSIGAALLYASPHGDPLRRAVGYVQSSRRVEARRAQQLAFGAGLVLTLLSTPVVLAVGNQRAAQEMAQRQQQLDLLERQQAAAEAQRRADAARAAAAQAEAARIRAERDAAAAQAAEQARQRRAAEDAQRAAQRAAAEQEAQARQAREDAQRTAQRKVAQQQRAAQAQQAEAARVAAEGPFTRAQAEERCTDAFALKLGVRARDVHQQGSYVEIMDSKPVNMLWGDGRLWVWRPDFKLAGGSQVYSMVCRVFENGTVDYDVEAR